MLEDDATDADLTIRSLNKSWPESTVKHVSTVEDAIGLLKQQADFDIALLDMNLPDGSGLDVLINIRQSDTDMAVSMLTGSGDEEVAVAALKSGADDYMVKQSGYVSKISRSVEFAIENRKKMRQQESSVIPVIYIEDNPTDIDLTRRHLARYAPYIQLTDVSTSEAAFSLLPLAGTNPEDWTFRVILMDYRLPGMSALEVIKEIRHVRNLDMPIVIVTSHGDEDVAVQALKLGASDYLVKRDNYLTRLPSLITGVYQHAELRRKQKALAESEMQYRLLAENSEDIIFTLDFDLNYTYISRPYILFAVTGQKRLWVKILRRHSRQLLIIG